MARDVVNIKFRNPLKLRSDLSGKHHAISQDLYNLLFVPSIKDKHTNK
jgi:hypothetical protein